MADNWQAGDVALCVDDRWWNEDNHKCYIKEGETYTIMAIVIADSMSPYGAGPRPVLCLLEATNTALEGRGGYDARRFQKQPTLVITDTVETGETV